MKRITPLAFAVLLGTGLLLGTGCASTRGKTAAGRNPSLVERNPSTDVRAHQVRDRTTRLWRSGQYVSRDDARRAAEKDFPATDATDNAEWSQQYAQAVRAKASQDRLERDLEKLYRK